MTASTGNWQEGVAKRVAPLQIIVAVMVVGCALYLVVALVVGARQGPPEWQPPGLLTWIAIVIAAQTVVMRLLSLWWITSRARRTVVRGTFEDAAWKVEFEGGEEPPAPEGDARRLFAIFRARTIIGAALFEGCAFLTIISYFAEHNAASVVLAVVLALCVAAHLPTRAGTIRWIEDQLASVEQERSFLR